jgi:putative FmdB family regulatory protein
MPLFEFACEKCGREMELLVRHAEEPNCPDCGSRRMRKLLPIVAAPGRDREEPGRGEMPAGPCGSACGCFPHG